MLLMVAKGILVGFVIAAPLGPIGILCIRRTLIHGRLSGFLSGLGAATADGVFGLLSIVGLTTLVNLFVGWQNVLRIFGGIFLLILGLKYFFSKSEISKIGIRNENRILIYLSTLGLTFTNPITILSFTAVFSGLRLEGTTNELSTGIWLALGVFLGSTSWWLILVLVSGMVKNILNLGILKWVNRVSGFLIFSFGLTILISQISLNINKLSSTVEVDGLRNIIPADSSGFSRAFPGKTFTFPMDHGSHPDYKTEWWYITGNVEDQTGRRFGYQFTIFRRALFPLKDTLQRQSLWGVEQIYLGHFAISDIKDNQHYAFEDLARGSVGISGTNTDPFAVWIKDWEIRQLDINTFQLKASSYLEDGSLMQIDFNLIDQKGIVLHGDSGYHQKGPGEGNASFYYSMTRLLTSGELTIKDNVYKVEGLSWMDHEFSTTALSFNQVGWDWFAIQFDDGSELMVYQIRNQDGSKDTFSSGTWISSDNQKVDIRRDDFQINVLDYWESGTSKGIYPSRWELMIDKIGLRINLEPLIEDQEMDLFYTYWEGAVRANGLLNGVSIEGFGYTEMTGYAGTMAGEF